MTFEREKDFEETLIKALTEHGWEKAPRISPNCPWVYACSLRSAAMNVPVFFMSMPLPPKNTLAQQATSVFTKNSESLDICHQGLFQAFRDGIRGTHKKYHLVQLYTSLFHKSCLKQMLSYRLILDARQS